jgi:hypothetical protein
MRPLLGDAGIHRSAPARAAGSSEKGFAAHTPEISVSKIVAARITSAAVGCLGADATVKTLPGLLAKVKGFKEGGPNPYPWSTGLNIRARLLLRSGRPPRFVRIDPSPYKQGIQTSPANYRYFHRARKSSWSEMHAN